MATITDRISLYDLYGVLGMFFAHIVHRLIVDDLFEPAVTSAAALFLLLTSGMLVGYECHDLIHEPDTDHTP